MGLLDKLLGTKDKLGPREKPITKVDKIMIKHEGKKGGDGK